MIELYKKIMSVDATRGWPNQFPIGLILLALLIVPPLSLFVPILTAIIIEKPAGVLDVLDFQFPLVILMFSWPGYVIFAVLGIPTLYILSRFDCTRLWIFAVIGMICTEIPWLVGIFASPGDPETVHARLRATIPTFAVVGIFNGIITRLIVLGTRRPL